MNSSTFRPDIREYTSRSSIGVMLNLYEASRRTRDDLERIPGEVADALLYDPSYAANGEPYPRIALPEPLQQSSSLEEALLTRTSLRFFSEESVELAQLATILKTASAGDEQDWSQERAKGIALNLLVVAWRVHGLAPAVYSYIPESHELARTNTVPDQYTEGKDLVLQTEFADAPVIVLITGNLAAACMRHGAWGHRQLLLRAGAAGHRLWISSLGVGLVGTVFAGFLPRAAQRVANVDGYRNAGLFAYCTGHLHSNYMHLERRQ